MLTRIITCNSIYQNKKYISGFHEIHEIDNLQNYNHMIATINSIVSNNISFKPSDTTLDRVIISAEDEDMINSVIRYYDRNPIDVEVMEVEMAISLRQIM